MAHGGGDKFRVILGGGGGGGWIERSEIHATALATITAGGLASRPTTFDPALVEGVLHMQPIGFL